MEIKYPEVGVCGLSCRLCPNYHMDTQSRCLGCKSEGRIAVGCPFITCAVKKKGVEFCWDCMENETCGKWKTHREAGKVGDSFKCYQKLEEDIAFIQRNGVIKFEELQKTREQLLRMMLQEFNEGRSKRYYCIAATVFEVVELRNILNSANQNSQRQSIEEKSKVLHALLDAVASQKKYCLALRKGK